MPAQAFIYPLNTLDSDYHPELGIRVATLASLTKLGVPTPPVMVVSPEAVHAFLSENNLFSKIQAMLRELDAADPFSLESTARSLHKLVKTNPFPKELEEDIRHHYQKICHEGWVTLNFSFAASHPAVVPNHSVPVKGDVALLEDIRDMLASLFAPANLHHHLIKPDDSFLTKPPALVIRQFFPADLSGYIFTGTPDQKTVIRLEALWGQQPTADEAELIPDTYLVSRTTKALVHQEIVSQARLYTINRFGKKEQKPVPPKQQAAAKLSTNDLKKLAEVGEKIHHHAISPQKISWLIAAGKLYITKSKAYDPQVNTKNPAGERNQTANLKHLAKGEAAGPGLISGPAKVIKNPKEIANIKSGEIIVTPFVSIQLLPAFKKAAGIVAETGGPTSHAAIAARETGIPAIVNTKNATKLVKTGQVITINGSTGDLYLGGHTRKSYELPATSYQEPEQGASVQPATGNLQFTKTATKLMANITGGTKATELGLSNIDGIGRVRGELILAEYGIHPRQIIQKKLVADYRKHLELTLIKICQAFGNRPVYYQLSDLPSNQLALLSGGDRHEPQETNPLLGLHGATRMLVDTQWAEMELETVKEVRNQHGHKNLHLLLPFVRSKKELLDLKRLISAAGLTRGGFEILLLLQTPANLASVDDFAEVGIDGIGLDLFTIAGLMQGIDPDNPEVYHLQDVHHHGLWQLVRLGLQSAHSHQIKTLAYTDGVGKYEELLAELVNLGIGAISTEPHQLQYIRDALVRAEQKAIKELK